MIKPHNITLYLTIEGRFASGTFADWICHRADLLSLSGWVKMQSDSRIDVLVCGDAVMVDAMEVVCNLGPGDVLVDRIKSKPGNRADITDGFVQL